MTPKRSTGRKGKKGKKAKNEEPATIEPKIAPAAECIEAVELEPYALYGARPALAEMLMNPIPAKCENSSYPSSMKRHDGGTAPTKQ
ncbi:hypothetical protein S40285_10205 [Stachybotrys chlorohalonatus IBT 40285]|uniref:Uncharacterized protein n=1 Tax=Stachybotrys chlorohalonatus (strain IBT 40285) TaxID=1283841 RepID=A0A084QG77_STAC4|nr:hypothetical protein S40285_10205 [Stachybotrys chlorohalonata IBT 40285]